MKIEQDILKGFMSQTDLPLFSGVKVISHSMLEILPSENILCSYELTIPREILVRPLIPKSENHLLHIGLSSVKYREVPGIVP